jgi:hypothetical protein
MSPLGENCVYGTGGGGEENNVKMMNTINKFSLLAVLVLVSASWAAAQGPRRCCMRGGMARYDTATEATYKGTVEEVTQYSCPGMGGGGTHLTVKSEDRTLDVHLGPANFVASQKISFAKGDQIAVTGSKVKLGDDEVIIAREVKKGDTTLTLRDAQGVPKWSRGRGR